MLIIRRAAMVVFFACLISVCSAEDSVFSSDQVTSSMRLAADYVLQKQHFRRSEVLPDGKTSTSLIDQKPTNDWVRSAFYTGVLALYRATGDAKYLQKAMDWSEIAHWSPTPPGSRNADNQCCIQTYAELAIMNKNPKLIEASRAEFDSMMASPRAGRVDWWWCDSLFMAPPALARLAAASGDKSYLRFLDEMFWDSYEFLYDKQEHLFYRDKHFFHAKTRNGQKVFWSRGNGWVLAGLARVIEYLPPDYPGYDRYVHLFQEMAGRIASLQQPDGLWQPSLLDSRDFATSETSGSGFFTFALAWGVNNGLLERSKFEPVVRRGWSGLQSALSPEGRLGYVQQVAGAPGNVYSTGTQEYAVGAFLLAGAEVLKITERRLDLGGGPVERGFIGIKNEAYTTTRTYGWVDGLQFLQVRDRHTSDMLRRDFITSAEPASFRVDLDPGVYRLTLIEGDEDFGDHQLKVQTSSQTEELPVLKPGRAEYARLTTLVKILPSNIDADTTSGAISPHLLLHFSSPRKNWILNAIQLEHTTGSIATSLVTERFGSIHRRDASTSPWQNVFEWPDPTKKLLTQFEKNLDAAPAIRPTGLTRADYLKLIAGNVDFWKLHQDPSGAIIDPYKKIEWQYSTPCFALAAATLVAHANRKDLLEPAAKAMDWACQTLSERKAATAHEDFFPPQLAHALPLLKPRVTPDRAKKWEAELASIDPFKIYRSAPGHGNWNVVALSGEYLLYKLGLRKDLTFVEDCLEGQGATFRSPYGQYLEGPMAYDLFPRIWAADMIAAGYSGNRSRELTEVLRRGALTSLFMQSPWGELPMGGRSAHHQWNEAEQALTYEIYAARAKREGDLKLASAFKRGAHLALKSMYRWQRPSGELFIVKNRVDPAKRHGFEGYSAHSQYNLLPMAMLCIAWEHAEKTDDLPEGPAPADVGGFVFDIGEKLHKIFANAGGMYLEIDTNADLHYDATGLMRVHSNKIDPQLGPSDTLTQHSWPNLPGETSTTAAIGPEWIAPDGKPARLAEYGGAMVSGVTLMGIEESPRRVAFQVLYHGYFGGSPFVSERYVVTPDEVTVKTEIPGMRGPTRFVWPVLSDNGSSSTRIAVHDKTVTVSFDGLNAQTFTAPGASDIHLSDVKYPNRNGWARLATADFPEGGEMEFIIKPVNATSGRQDSIEHP
jgi:rhamnogalacturonyl hydrolase YesR